MSILKKSIVFIFLLFGCKAYGFSIYPMFIDMGSSGANSRSTIVVENTSPRAMPVKTNVSELTLDMNGRVSASKNSSDFIVFPPQAVIKPHSKQSFRIQWRGAANLGIGKTYEISVSQVIVENHNSDKKSEGTEFKVDIGMSFGAIVNMNAPSGQPKPQVEANRVILNKKNKPALDVVISNSGNQNFLLAKSDSTVLIYGLGQKLLWKHTYTPTDIVRNFGLGIVQPKSRRRMEVPLPNLPDNIARQAKSVKLEIRPSAK